jgi:hypothetical protein
MIGAQLALRPRPGLLDVREFGPVAWTLAALALALSCPGVPFVLGPAALGVVHIVNDYRYLIRRQQLPRLMLAVIGVACLALVVLRAVDAVARAPVVLARIEMSVGWGATLFATGLGAVLARTWWRGFGLATLIVGFGVAAVMFPVLSRSVFAQAHNVVGIALWWSLFRRRGAAALVTLGSIVFATSMLLFGLLPPLVSFTSAWDQRMLTDTVAPWQSYLGSSGALGMGLSYVFLQAVHYGVWLSWVPSAVDGAGRSGPRERLRQMYADLGWRGGAFVAAAASLVVLASFFDVHRTRQVYLSVAVFHGYLELIAAAFLFTQLESRTSES